MTKDNNKKRIKKRYLIENIFKASMFASVVFAIFMLVVLLFSIFSKGYSAFFTNYLTVQVEFKEDILFDEYNEGYFEDAYIEEIISYSIKEEVANYLKKKLLGTNEISQLENQEEYFKTIDEELEFIDFQGMISSYNIFDVREEFISNKELLNTSKEYQILVSSEVDMYLKGYLGSGSILDEETIKVIEVLKEENKIKTKFNTIFFTNADSRYPELAGIKGAFFGSLYTISMVIVFSIIISVGAAIYLEEFARRGKIVEFIEVNINNLAAVPSIVFGLLGLIVFEQFFGVPRATPLLAAFVLTLMTLPTVIITSRIALSAVPSSIREGAFAVGSSKIQVIVYHLLPVSFPGILTGMIISISRVIGETAPLLMIGMVAYISSSPESIVSKATVFPVQILLWSDSPEVGYIEKASAASMILLIFLIFMNWISIYLRNKFEIKL